ncbi:hypothetical protein NLU13_4157 [Sarocladium strictum]|uniref:Uncharacterized protein n=1 Tax=Sarocladium strictum TaxID=5046 RepID=A0AA39GKX0_SARSR|nr:hypothetical protein NLU13_4157 [Sarocladium strictum]
MKAQTLAPFAFAAAAEGLSLLAGVDINLPLGIDIDLLANLGSKPTTGPCDECTNVYHPPHHGVDIDECDNDEDDGWHWVHPGKPHHPEQPQYTWGTSTLTCTETSTIIGCPPEVEHCPASSTAYTTVTEVESTTICPVPITTATGEKPPATETYIPAKPTTTSVYYPPIKTTTIPLEEWYPTTTLVAQPPPVHTSVYVPPVHETPAYNPPASETTVWVPPPAVGTPEHPAPPAKEYPAPPAQQHPPVEYPDYVAPPVATPIGHGNNQTIPPPATAGAAQTVQRIGVAVFAMVAAALL